MENELQNMEAQLNEQQLEMLRLLKRPLPDNDYREIKKHIVNILAKNIDNEMETLEKENNWTADTYEQWGNEHLRTAYKK